MTKKPNEKQPQAATQGMASPSKALEQIRELTARIQPALKLSDLINNSELKKIASTQQKMAEQLRASLQLPQLEQLKQLQLRELPQLELLRKRAGEAAAAISRTTANIQQQARPGALVSVSQKSKSSTAPVQGIASTGDLGRLVREVRRQRKLSQQAFADLTGVGRRFISELENGKQSLEVGKVLQVISACGIDLLARRR